MLASRSSGLTLWKTVWRFLKNLGIKPPYDPAIPLLGIYPEETKIERDTCIPLFIAALFTIARTWKQPRCPSTDEWIKKLWLICNMEYDTAILLLGIYPEETKIERDTCITLFIAALFTIARTWKQPRCPSTDE